MEDKKPVDLKDVLSIVQQQQQAQTVKWQLSNADILATIKTFLEGKYTDPVNGIEIEFGGRLMNEKGINAILQVVASFTHKGVVLSNLSDKEIYRLAKAIHITVLDDLFQHWQEYEMDPNKLPMIALTVSGNVFFALMRAKGGGERKIIGLSQKIVERVVQSVKGGGILPPV